MTRTTITPTIAHVPWMGELATPQTLARLARAQRRHARILAQDRVTFSRAVDASNAMQAYEEAHPFEWAPPELQDELRAAVREAGRVQWLAARHGRWTMALWHAVYSPVAPLTTARAPQTYATPRTAQPSNMAVLVA